MTSSPLPADARPIAPDLLTEDQVRVLSDVAQALSSIVRGNDDDELAARRDGARGSPSQPPWATVDAHRTPRVLFIDGARGVGKTSTMLTLVRALSEGRDNVYYVHDNRADSSWASPSHLGAVRALQPLDFDPMPPGLPLLAWIVRAFWTLVRWADSTCNSSSRRGLDGAERRAGSGQTLMDVWTRLQDDAVVAWREPSDHAPYEGAEAQLKRVRKWGSLAEDWRRFLDQLVDVLADRGAWNPAGRGVMLLPIDHADLQISRTPELVRVLHALHHPRLVFLLVGDLRLMAHAVQLQLDGQRAELAFGNPETGDDDPDDGDSHSAPRRVPGAWLGDRPETMDLGRRLVERVFRSRLVFRLGPRG